MQITGTFEIAAPPETVWSCIEDPELQKKWMHGLEETSWPDGRGDGGEGTRFVQKIREGGRIQLYEGVILTKERPRHLGLRVGNRHFSMQVHYRLSGIPAGTRLDYSCATETTGVIVKVVSFLFGGFTKRIVRRQMASLKVLAERKP